MLTCDRNNGKDDQTPSDKKSNKTEDHKNEGFIKSAWHKLTHQHDNLEESTDNKQQESSKDDDEPKKASGSG